MCMVGTWIGGLTFVLCLGGQFEMDEWAGTWRELVCVFYYLSESKSIQSKDTASSGAFLVGLVFWLVVC